MKQNSSSSLNDHRREICKSIISCIYIGTHRPIWVIRAPASGTLPEALSPLSWVQASCLFVFPIEAAKLYSCPRNAQLKTFAYKGKKKELRKRKAQEMPLLTTNGRKLIHVAKIELKRGRLKGAGKFKVVVSHSGSAAAATGS
jgi:hypothetical protein